MSGYGQGKDPALKIRSRNQMAAAQAHRDLEDGKAAIAESKLLESIWKVFKDDNEQDGSGRDRKVYSRWLQGTL